MKQKNYFIEEIKQNELISKKHKKAVIKKYKSIIKNRRNINKIVTLAKAS